MSPVSYAPGERCRCFASRASPWAVTVDAGTARVTVESAVVTHPPPRVTTGRGIVSFVASLTPGVPSAEA